MYQVKIAELKSHLSEHIKKVRNGAEVLVMDRYTPVAKLSPIQKTRGDATPILSKQKGNPKDLLKIPRPHLKKTIPLDELLASERADR